MSQITKSLGMSDQIYGSHYFNDKGFRFREEQEHYQRQQMERDLVLREQMRYTMSAQQMQEQKAIKPTEPAYTSNNKLLLLEN